MLGAEVAVITNIEADHLDNYSGMAEIRENFLRFASRTEKMLIASADDPQVGAVAEQAAREGLEVRTFGRSAGAHYRLGEVTAEGFSTRFTLRGPDGRTHTSTIPAPGEQNALTAAAALAAAHALGCDLGAAASAVQRFTGSGRRMEFKGEGAGVRVYDSYAHHPTEVAADLKAVRAALDSSPTAGQGRVIALFQPHLYSRTRAFAAEFAGALALADEAVVLPVYAAREDPQPGVDATLITSADAGGGRLRHHGDRDGAPALLAELARPGDVVLTMGAGDVDRLARELAA
jgi:UDP-N-acetylmuramate--alanine ligase